MKFPFLTFSLLSLASAQAADQSFRSFYTFQGLPAIQEEGNPDTVYLFDSVRSGTSSTFAKLPLFLREGGFSGLTQMPQGRVGTDFCTITDQGLSFGFTRPGLTGTVFAIPKYHQKIVCFEVNALGISILSIDSIASLESPSIYTVGTPSNKAPSEIAVPLNIKTGLIDLDPSHRLPALPNGYDFESIRYWQGHWFLSDEYGPMLVDVDQSSRKIQREWRPGAGLPRVYSRRRPGRSFTALAVTPGGRLLAMPQSALWNGSDSGMEQSTQDSRIQRMLLLTPDSGHWKEFVYLNDIKGGQRRSRDCKVGDAVAITDTRFLVLEHGIDLSGKDIIDLYITDIAGATDVSIPAAVDGSDAFGIRFGTATLEELNDSVTLVTKRIKPVTKTLVWSSQSSTNPWTSDRPQGLEIVNDTIVAILSDNKYGTKDMSLEPYPHVQAYSKGISQLMFLKVASLSGKIKAPKSVKPAASGLIPRVEISKGIAAISIPHVDAQGNVSGWTDLSGRLKR